MGLNGTIIRTDHPPHLRAYNTNRLPFFHIFRRASLFIIIFLISFHLPSFVPSFDQRGQSIKEILEILEKQRTGLADVAKEELAEVIYEEATRYNHDPKFILALIAIESEFYNWSVSEKGAKGLMQIMPYVAESLSQELGIEWSGDRTLFNPYLNIKMGIHYFSQLALDFKDVGVALTAYNYGPTYVRGLIERNERIPNDYSRKVLNAYRRI
jgi:soluble lytic murein transglycosylase-like protein